jgi:hypothetical protein
LVDPLHAILKRSEREPAILHADQVGAWPAGDLEHWVATGVLRPMNPAGSLPCLGCSGEYVGEVVFLTDPETNSTRAYLPCPHCGPSSIPPAALRRWRIDVERLVEVLFTGVASDLRLTCVEVGRLWRIGRSSGPGGAFAVFFGRQLHRADAGEILESARIPSKAIVFAPLYTPARSVKSRGALVLPLLSVVSSSSGTVHFDRQQVANRLAEWLQSRVHPTKRPVRKRATRAADIAALTKELQEHLRAARDYAISTRDRTGQPQLLPRPTQEDLARRIGSSQWTVSRCLNDPEARELVFLWELAVDLDRLLVHTG